MSNSSELSSSSEMQSIYVADELEWRVENLLILNKISFEILQGEFVGIVGPNGAGKSSLLRCLYGKNKPTSGKILFKGEPLHKYSRRQIAQDVAVLIQEPPTHFDMSVFEVVALGLIPHRPLLSFNSQADDQIVRAAVEKVELQSKISDAFNTLSGGEKQRVMVARAIVQDPKILILDEPTNHLDVQHQIDVLKLAKQMNITVLLSIHDLNMAAAFCDRLILMDKGKVVTSGSPARVLNKTNLKQVFNVDADVDNHPFHPGPRITFDFSESNQHRNIDIQQSTKNSQIGMPENEI